MGCIVNLNSAATASLRLTSPTEGDKKERGFCCFPRRRHRRHHQFRPPSVIDTRRIGGAMGPITIYRGVQSESIFSEA
ncbi:hypothetical protein DEO72_LG8g2768 [Vigna unguiculata]|uniref:Uncharacterized protein n=1 Tax=Vigna unguiculata TaxID=3917 RepID=A0A4D6MT83_VIGUN|nr:hypothetical protein DEO72_LG8g2768 [Vigna unguiculata]